MANVGFPQSSQDGVANRVHQGVGVGMSIQPLGMGNLNPSEDEFSTFDQRVNIVTATHMNHAPA
jgi:hypothetical protein